MLGRGGKPETLPKTNFFIGCAVSPFKRHERELMPQYFKLVRKIAAGAQWVIPQLGYDMRKFHEVKLFLETRGIKAPIIGNVYLLSKGVAAVPAASWPAASSATSCCEDRKIRRRAGQGQAVLPGTGRQTVGRVQGAGFRGRLPRRHPSGRRFRPDHRAGRKLKPDNWREFLKEIRFSQPDEFFLFDHDLHTGMSQSGRINREYLSSFRRRAEVERGDDQLSLVAVGPQGGVHAR